MLILRELLLGARRYSELQRSLSGITTNLLAKRMRELESSGLVERVRRRSDGKRAWALTHDGEAVRPALLELGRFGARFMGAPGDDRLSARWFVVSLQRRYRGDLPPTIIGLHLDEEWYTLRIEGPTLVASDGRPDASDVEIEGTLQSVAGMLSGGAATAVRVSGDPKRVEGLVWGVEA